MSTVEATPSPGIAAVTNRQTFEELYETEYRSMVRLAFALVDTQQQAEEVAQDAFAIVFERYDRIDQPLPYLRSVVLNQCRRILRRRVLLRRQPIPPGEDGALGASDVVDAVQRLPHKQRSMVVLRYDAQLTDREIAETLGVPLGTVKSTLHRAIATLRKELR